MADITAIPGARCLAVLGRNYAKDTIVANTFNRQWVYKMVDQLEAQDSNKAFRSMAIRVSEGINKLDVSGGPEDDKALGVVLPVDDSIVSKMAMRLGSLLINKLPDRLVNHLGTFHWGSVLHCYGTCLHSCAGAEGILIPFLRYLRDIWLWNPYSAQYFKTSTEYLVQQRTSYFTFGVQSTIQKCRNLAKLDSTLWDSGKIVYLHSFSIRPSSSLLLTSFTSGAISLLQLKGSGLKIELISVRRYLEKEIE